jgi:CDP-4-dehydro-6-deoxyglucose reductase
MSQLLTVSRAARLVGATRGALQSRIQSGELQAYDGMVSVDDLLRLYPETRLEETGAFERVSRIKEESFGRRVRERMLPSQDVLAQRLFEQSRELADLRSHLQQYHALVVRLEDKLRALGQSAAGQTRKFLAQLEDFLETELQDILGKSEQPNALALMNDMLGVMSAHVVVHPSGHDFFVDGADTILDAALRAGLSINYGCSSGNCGLCKARIVSGQIQRVRHQDYVLSEAEKLQGYSLLCSNTAVSDLIIEALEAANPEDIPRQQIVARVKAINRLSDDVVMLQLQTPRNSRLRFLAGQSVTLSMHGAEAIQLPVASCPCDDRNLQFHIEHDPNHSFVQKVFSGLGSGDSVTIWGPWGDFVLRPESARPILFVACDTGFAPIKSLIEHAMALDAAGTIHLYWLATRPGGHYLANLCRSWAGALENFGYTPLEDANGNGATVRGALELVRRMDESHPQILEYDLYLAGPGAFVDTIGAHLRQRRFPQEQLAVAVV